MFPDYINIRSFDLGSDQNVVSSESRSLIPHDRVLPGHRWTGRFDVGVRPGDTAKARGWLFSLQRDGATIDYTDIDWIRNVANRTVAADTSRGNNQVPISSSVDAEPGMLLNFGGHPKMYMVMSTTPGSIEIFPELHADVLQNEAVVFDNPVVELELPAELKRTALFSNDGVYDLSTFRIRMNEVRR